MRAIFVLWSADHFILCKIFQADCASVRRNCDTCDGNALCFSRGTVSRRRKDHVFVVLGRLHSLSLLVNSMSQNIGDKVFSISSTHFSDGFQLWIDITCSGRARSDAIACSSCRRLRRLISCVKVVPRRVVTTSVGAISRGCITVLISGFNVVGGSWCRGACIGVGIFRSSLVGLGFANNAQQDTAHNEQNDEENS